MHTHIQVFGKFLRIKIPILASLYLPSSVIGGLVGLLIITCIKTNPAAYAYTQSEFLLGWNKCAGFLINIVFASLFLGQKIPGAKEVWNKSGPQLMYGMIVAWGQWVSGLLITMLVVCCAALCIWQHFGMQRLSLGSILTVSQSFTLFTAVDASVRRSRALRHDPTYRLRRRPRHG